MYSWFPEKRLLSWLYAEGQLDSEDIKSVQYTEQIHFHEPHGTKTNSTSVTSKYTICFPRSCLGRAYKINFEGDMSQVPAMWEGGWWVSTHLPLLIVVDFSNPLTYLSAGLKKIFKYLLFLKKQIFLLLFMSLMSGEGGQLCK